MIVNYYTEFKNSMLLNNAFFQFLTEEIKVMLITDNYVFDPLHFTTAVLVPGDEIVDPGYVAGGKTLTGKNRVNQSLFADNLSWASINTPVSGALMYKAGGGLLMAHIDFEATYNPFGDGIQFNWSPSGAFVLSTD